MTRTPGSVRGAAGDGRPYRHRWSNLETGIEERARLPGYREEAVVRHFDAPEAVETRFYEVRAKSILNRVPEASQMPFRWTINRLSRLHPRLHLLPRLGDACSHGRRAPQTDR